MANPDVGKVVGLDDHRGQAEGVTWRVLDIRDPALATRLGKVDTVVHLAARHRRSTATGASRASSTSAAPRPCSPRPPPPAYAGWCCARRRWSTARWPDNPLPLAEDAPLRAVPDGGLVSDWLEVERLAAQAPRSHPGLQVTVRPPGDRGRARASTAC